MYEAAAAGLPTINILNSKEHLNLFNDLIEREVAFEVGVFPDYDEDALLQKLSFFDLNRKILLDIYKRTDYIRFKLENNKIVEQLVNNL